MSRFGMAMGMHPGSFVSRTRGMARIVSSQKVMVYTWIYRAVT